MIGQVQIDAMLKKSGIDTTVTTLTNEQIAQALGVTHVVWVPDSETGLWEAELEASQRVTLVRVCREGEPVPAFLIMRSCYRYAQH